MLPHPPLGRGIGQREMEPEKPPVPFQGTGGNQLSRFVRGQLTTGRLGAEQVSPDQSCPVGTVGVGSILFSHAVAEGSSIPMVVNFDALTQRTQS
jgi:hypothetical protein